jgi:hypothetical protein
MRKRTRRNPAFKAKVALSGIVNLTNLRTIFGNFRGSNTASRA